MFIPWWAILGIAIWMYVLFRQARMDSRSEGRNLAVAEARAARCPRCTEYHEDDHGEDEDLDDDDLDPYIVVKGSEPD
jgi:hypothetical protein